MSEDDDSLPDTETASVSRLLREIIRGATISISSHGFNGFGRLGLAYVITVLISPAAYGVISVMLQVKRFLRFFVSGAFTAISRTLPRYDVAEKNYLITLFFIALALFTAGVAVITHAFRDEIIARTLFTPDQANVVSLFGLTFFLFIMLVGVDSILRAERRILISTIIDKAGRPMAQLIIVTIAIVGFGLATVYELWLAVTVAIALMLVVGLFSLFKFSPYAPNNTDSSSEAVNDYLSYATRSIPTAILGSFQAFSYSIFVVIFLSSVEAGIFGVAFALGGLIRWPLSSVNHIFPPIASGLYDAGRVEDINKLYSDTTQLIMIISGALCTAAIIYAPALLGFFSQTYVSGAFALRFVAIGNFTASSIGTVGLLLLMTDNEDASFRLQIFLASVSIPSLWFLTTTYGLTGLAGGFMFILMLNNVTELLLLNYKEGLQPFHKSHLMILIGYVIVGLLLSGLGVFLPTSVHVIIGVLALIATMAVMAEYVVTDRVYSLLCSYASNL